MATLAASPPTRRTRPREATRFDVQGLRAFAVLAVVLYHLWPNRLPGGFVGVDVFFVISGYLITGHLLRELTRTGRIALGQFWARRAKRLLPAAFLTILATGAAVLIWVPYSLWGQYGRELIASTVYVQNWQLASDSVDYLAQGNQPSPFQHFWSLSVEEQFYIALPLLLIGLGAVLHRVRRRRTPASTVRSDSTVEAAGAWSVDPVTVTRILLGAVVVASLAWSIVQTHTSPGVAYFSTATRAWEFALGGLASTLVLHAPRTAVARGVRIGGSLLGVVLLVLALFVIDGDTPFPGIAAALPVVGAGLVVLLGAHSGLQVVGRFAPIAFLGRISYAVYLWHWPMVVILPIALHHDLTTKDKAAILAASIVIASASTLLLEEPLRFARRVQALRPRRVALAGALGTVLVVALGATTLTGAHVQEVQAADFAKRLAASDVDCFGAAARIGSAKPCVDPRLADVRIPRHKDPNRGECWSSGEDSTFNLCTLGPRTGFTKHLLAIGDSHNNALIGAYEKIAEQRGWRIDLAGHSGCYLTTAEQFNVSQATIDACNTWKQHAFAYVDAHTDVDALLVTHSTGNTPVTPPAGESVDDATVRGLVEAWRAPVAAGVPIIAIRDNPIGRDDVVTCVSSMTGPTTGACDLPRDQALRFDGSTQAMAQVHDGRVIDMTDLYCNATTCPEVIGGVVVHRDQTHLSDVFALTLAPFLGSRIATALDELGR
jgi:peptidoglycan/LPS O-acetylase OafA/YrhL